MSQDQSSPPRPYLDFKQKYPEVVDAYEQLGVACLNSGPLDNKSRALIKLGIAFGAGLESASHAHVRKARDAGANAEEIRHAALLATTTIGFSSMMRSMSWVNDVLGRD